MKPRAVTILLFLLLAAALLWLNTLGGVSFTSRDLWLRGWPFSFESLIPTFRPTKEFNVVAFLLNIPCWLFLALLPPYILERLLRRTLRIHLGTAIILMLTAALLLGFNISMQPALSQFGWPQKFCAVAATGTYWYPAAAVGNALITLTLLCAVTLLIKTISTLKVPKMKPRNLIIFQLLILAVAYLVEYLIDPGNFRLYNILSIIMLTQLPLHLIERLRKRTLHIHLATAVVLSILAAILLGLNLVPHSTPPQYGWPVTSYGLPAADRIFGQWAVSAFLGNLFLALTLLAAAALLSEKLLARRAPKSDPA